MLKQFLQVYKLFAILAIVPIFTSCYKKESYNYSASEFFDQMTIEGDTTSALLSNNTSERLLKFQFPIETDPSLTKLLIVTSNGKFKESDDDSLNLDFVMLSDDENYRVSEATLIASNKSTDYEVKVYLQNYVREFTIPSETAEVDSVSLSSSVFYISNDTTTTIDLEATLTNGSGLASTGESVTFSAPSFGILSSQFGTSNSEGKSKVQFVFTDTSFIGQMVFSASIVNPQGQTVTTTQSVEVLD